MANTINSVPLSSLHPQNDLHWCILAASVGGDSTRLRRHRRNFIERDGDWVHRTYHHHRGNNTMLPVHLAALSSPHQRPSFCLFIDWVRDRKMFVSTYWGMRTNRFTVGQKVIIDRGNANVLHEGKTRRRNNRQLTTIGMSTDGGSTITGRCLRRIDYDESI